MIRYQISVDGRPSTADRRVRVSVFDLLGREVAVLVDEEKPEGSYTATWYAVAVPSGVYFGRLSAVTFTQTRTMLLLR